MFKRRHPLKRAADRGALVLFLLCQLNLSGLAARPAPAFAIAVRTSVAGETTRVTVTGTAPLPHGLRRIDDATLVVELPGVDAAKLSPSYLSNSPLVAGVSVRCDKSATGEPLARLFVALRRPVRERSYLDGNEVVLELTPAVVGSGAKSGDDANATSDRSFDQGAARGTAPPSQQLRPAPSPAPAGSGRGAVAAATTSPAAQGQRYGEYGFVGEPINLNVVNADIRDILNYITEQYGVNFIIDSSVGAVPVTVNVTEVPWNLALDSILRANRLGIEVTGNILRVATLKVLAEEAEAQKTINEAKLENAELVTEFIRLNYARAVGTLAQTAGSTGGFSGGASNQSFSGGAGGDATGKSGDQGILPIISRRLSRRGSVEVDGRSNTLIVTDVRENIASIRQLVALLDQPEPQVEIETRIVVASRNFSRDLGVQLGAGVFSTKNGVLNAGGTLNTVPGTFIEGESGDKRIIGLRPGGIPEGFGIDPTRALGANAPSTVIGLTTGIFGTAQISAQITAAEAKGQAKIIANPRVTALNNRPAQIESGSQVPVVTPQTGAGSGVVFTTTFVSVPLRLSVTPQITDAGTVVLRVTAENNSVNLSLTNSLGTPGIDTQRMQTEVLVPDGGTTIVGGVLADIEGETQNRTPGVSGIPILGNLFKRRATTRTTNELLFFITPRIYRPDFQGRPVAGTVTDRTRSATIPQPVPLGNPQTNTPPPVAPGQPAPQQPEAQTPLPAAAPAARPGAERPPTEEEE